MKKGRKRFYLLHGNSLAYKVFYSYPETTDSRGRMNNALRGFGLTILKLREENPDYMAVVFDTPAPEIKQKRNLRFQFQHPLMVPELEKQIPPIKEMVRAFRIPIYEIKGYSAGDVLATLTQKAREEGVEVTIFSSNKSVLQLVGEGVVVSNPHLNYRKFDEEEVKKELGVYPSAIPHLIGLKGEAGEDIPGLPGIGDKTALELLQRYGTLERIFKNLEKLSKGVREILREYRQRALISRRVATLNRAVPLKFSLEECPVKEPDKEMLAKLLQEYELTGLLSRVSVYHRPQEARYRTVLGENALEELLREMERGEEFALDTETTGVNPMKASLVGVSISTRPHRAFYIPLGHNYLNAPQQLDKRTVLERLRPFLADKKRLKIGQNIKYDIIVLAREGVEVEGNLFDTMIASYLLLPERGHHNLKSLALRYLGHKMVPITEFIGKGKGVLTLAQVEVEKVSEYSCEDASVAFLLREHLAPLLKEKGLEGLFYKVEMPLIPVLVDMERTGVKIDCPYLEALAEEVEKRMEKMAGEIFLMAGMSFNLNSPKQVSMVLFEKLGLSPRRRGKTGYSTSQAVLSRLARENEIVAKIMEYRNLSKIKSGYLDTLPAMVNPQTGRLHTSYHQAATSTGRLSSSQPNLQNIPIRGELGSRIRRGFIAEEGKLLVSADYSQIELRIMAHLSEDEGLMAAFYQDVDIHAQTASQIFNVSLQEVTPDMRREAKAVNFGIIYGMSPYGLAQDLGISTEKAARYIEAYFLQHPRVKEHIEKTLEKCREKGYVKTILGRRRYLPQINHTNLNLRRRAEREAMNTPIQGSAAELIKLAMIDIHNKLNERNLRAKLILQIHDELLLEVPEKEVEEVRELVRNSMEKAMTLRVPVKVVVNTGKNWLEAH